jgi:hypothetical protein
MHRGGCMCAEDLHLCRTKVLPEKIDAAPIKNIAFKGLCERNKCTSSCPHTSVHS